MRSRKMTEKKPRQLLRTAIDPHVLTTEFEEGRDVLKPEAERVGLPVRRVVGEQNLALQVLPSRRVVSTTANQLEGTTYRYQRALETSSPWPCRPRRSGPGEKRRVRRCCSLAGHRGWRPSRPTRHRRGRRPRTRARTGTRGLEMEPLGKAGMAAGQGAVRGWCWRRPSRGR